MIALSIQIEGQDGLTWTRWKGLVETTEAAGFAGLFRSDHFTNAQPPDKEALETIISLTYAADHTRRVELGTLVAPISFRHPTLLARQATALDDLSGGRFVLGLGAGWQEREHTLFGHDLGDVQTRMARFEEGLEVITRLLHSDEPVTFEGRFFQLRDAVLLPRPQRQSGPHIMIGGNGPQRTLPLAARYADIWNAIGLTPQAFRERSTLLDDLLNRQGRDPRSVRRTMMLSIAFGRDPQELERHLSRLGYTFDNAQARDAFVQQLVDGGRALAGTPEAIKQQLARYDEAGVEELMLQWFDMDNLEGLHAFGESVIG